MPKGLYERQKRGSYYKPTPENNLIKRNLFITPKQFETIKYLSEKNNLSYSEIVRQALDKYFTDNRIKN